MDFSNNTVLVTGGGSGIGLAITKHFLDAGSLVVQKSLEKLTA